MLTEQTAENVFANAEIHRYPIDDATLAVRKFGDGPNLLLIHGYPVHGYTWRKLVPTLSKYYRCYVVDLPGLGDSDWRDGTDFSFSAQATRLCKWLDEMGIKQCAIVAHNTGATIARLVALQRSDVVEKLALINTEIPHHRPPWIPLYQWSARLPLAKPVFRQLLNNRRFIQSSMGLRQFYFDKKMLDDECNVGPYISPLVNSKKRLAGMLGYLGGIDWDIVDGMATEHRNINAAVLFLWGENDRTFPVQLGEQMVHQFETACRFERIASSSLLPHEEKPDQVLEYLIPFLSQAQA